MYGNEARHLFVINKLMSFALNFDLFYVQHFKLQSDKELCSCYTVAEITCS